MANWSLFIRRVGAYCIDIVLLFAILAPLGAAVQSVLRIQPHTPPDVWLATVWNFSLPVWLYFILCDRSAYGATIGKRILGIRVSDVHGARLGLGRAVGRTAIKLIPWEIIHLTLFGMATDFTQWGTAQTIGMTLANVLALLYLALAVRTGGRRSAHDYVVSSEVRLANTSARQATQ